MVPKLNRHISAEPLAPGWKEHLDPGSQKSYYYNATTEETKWERPEPPAAAPPPPPETVPTSPPLPETSQNSMPLAETGHTPLQRAQSEPRPQSESPALPAVLNRTRSSEVLPTPDYRISAEGSIHPDDEVLWTGVIQKTGDKTIRKRYRDRYFVLESGGCLHYWALTSNNAANKNMIESTAFELWQREDMIDPRFKPYSAVAELLLQKFELKGSIPCRDIESTDLTSSYHATFNIKLRDDGRTYKMKASSVSQFKVCSTLHFHRKAVPNTSSFCSTIRGSSA